MYSRVFVLGLTVVLVSFARADTSPAVVQLWERPNFKGKELTIRADYVYGCKVVPTDWSHVSSVNTTGNCIVAYKGSDCTGILGYIMPGSPYHEYLQLFLGFDDTPRSFQLCELILPDFNDKYYEPCTKRPCFRSFSKKGTEYRFWNLLLDIQDPKKAEVFRNEVAASNGSIDWRFVLTNARATTRPSDAYREAVLQEANRMKDLPKRGSFFNLKNVRQLKNLACEVIYWREMAMNAFDWDYKDTDYATLKAGVLLWRTLVDSIRPALSFWRNEDLLCKNPPDVTEGVLYID